MNKSVQIAGLLFGALGVASGGQGASPLDPQLRGTVSPASGDQLADIEGRLGFAPAAEQPVQAQRNAAQALIDRLVQRGLEASPDLKADVATLAARAAGVDEARAAYHPTAMLNSNLSQNVSHAVDQDAAERRRDLNGVLTLTENLYRGGQDARQIEITERDRRVAALSRDTRVESVGYEVRHTALQYNYASMVQLISEAAARDSESFRHLTERKFGAGQVGKVDVYTAVMRESDDKAQAARARLSASEAYYALLRAIGLASEADQELAGELRLLAQVSLPVPQEPPPLPPPAPTTLAEASAQATEEKAALTVSQAYRNRFLPTFDLVGTVDRDHTYTHLDPGLLPPYQLTTGTTQETLTYTVALQLTWPLYDRPRDQTIAVNAHLRDAAAAQTLAAKTEAGIETVTLRAHIADVYKTLGPFREAYLDAGRLYSAQRKLYEAGAVDVFVVTDADRERLTALRSWFDTVFSLEQDLLKWDALTKGYLVTAAAG